ncbi:MAG: TRAFs-binding domain-containing protein [Candidatus Gastranaerophilales bacterium]
MPFGKKKPISGFFNIDFDEIYNKAIKPAIEDSGFDCVRADEENNGGIIHTLMFERLVCSNVVIVDITNQNPNVYYELGFRHCAKPYYTIVIYDKSQRMPFDISILRAIPYNLKKGKITCEDAQDLKNNIITRLKLAQEYSNNPDSPAFELISEFPITKLEANSVKVFEEKWKITNELKNKLSLVINSSEINEIVEILKEKRVPVDYLIFEIIDAYKKFEDWDGLIQFIEIYKNTALENHCYIWQQLALGLNKRDNGNDKENAIKILEEVINNFGESAETFGLVASIYKDKMLKKESLTHEKAYLQKAIDYYRLGFNIDTKNYYTGINLATLLSYSDNEENLVILNKLLPVVIYNVELEDFTITNNYWLLATAYEAYILAFRFDDAKKMLEYITTLSPEPKAWEKASTLKNLKLIKSIYERKNSHTEWYKEFMVMLKIKEEI